MTSLVSGIVDDFQDLIKQQLQLTRKEIEADIRKAKEGASLLVAGLGVLFLGGIVLCLMMSHLIHWLASPAGSDPAAFPLWACHAVVGGVLALIGGGMTCAGWKTFNKIDPLQNPATDALKENVQWLTNQK